jgi:flagellar biosynthetic protein FlhB
VSQQQDLDRNDPATPFKLEKAHQKGSISKSQEATFAVVLVALTAVAFGLAEDALRGMAELVARAFAVGLNGELSPPAVVRLTAVLGQGGLQAIGSVLFVLWIAGLAISALQARGVFSTEPLKPNFDRINPGENFKRLFSLRTLYDTGRTGIKMVAIALAAAVWGAFHTGDLLLLVGLTPQATLRRSVDLFGSLLVLLTAVYALLAYVDWLYSNWDFLRQMRMSKREMRDEHKEREGNPRIKQRLRELRAEWAKRAKAVRRVGVADVLLTNPTHVSVAVQYRHGEMPAPRVLAKGRGEMAHRMRREAGRRGVPVVQNAPLARALYADVETEQFVPERHFAQLARILRWVYAARSSAARRT